MSILVMKRSVGILRQSRRTMHLEVHGADRNQKYRDCPMFLSHLFVTFSNACYQPRDFCHIIVVSILHLSIFLFFSCTNNHTYNNPVKHKEGHLSLTLSLVNQNLGFPETVNEVLSSRPYLNTFAQAHLPCQSPEASLLSFLLYYIVYNLESTAQHQNRMVDMGIPKT